MKRLSYALILVATSAVPGFGATLERQNIGRFLLSERKLENATELRIRGFLKQSAFTLGEPKSKIKGNIMQIQVPVKAFGNSSSSCDFTIKVPAHVERVDFGSQKTEIWPIDQYQNKQTEEQKRACAFVRQEEQANISDVSVEPADTKSQTFQIEAYHWKTGDLTTYIISRPEFKQLSKTVRHLGPVR